MSTTYSPLLPPPRPVTSPVRRRATFEPRVRGWWLAVVGIGLVAAYFVFQQMAAWNHENAVVRDGRAVDAIIDKAGFRSQTVKGALVSPESPLTLVYTVDGVEYTVDGYLPPRKEPIVVKSVLPIRVNPANPAQWTSRTRPTSVAAALVALWTLAPLVAISLLGAWNARRRVLKLYRSGTEDVATVVEARQAALAPASQFVRCSPHEARRLCHVYVPRTNVPLREGDEIVVLHDHAGRAVAVDWFDSTLTKAQG